MKRMAIFIVALIMLMPTISFAVQYGQWREADSGTMSTGSGLYIDSTNVYGGMEKAYKDGYSPVVSGGKARIIVPLLSSSGIAGNTLIVSPNLGDPSTSPFVFNNYQKKVSLEEHTVNGGRNKVQAFYVAFDLPLSSSRANGNYPVEIAISGNDKSGNPISQSFTTYVRIADGNSQTEIMPPVDTPPAEQKPQSKPILLVQSSEISPTPVNAGEEFSAKVVIKNTSTKKSVQNIVFTVSCESKGVNLLLNSNTIYLPKLGSNKTHTLDLKYKTSSGMETGAHTIKIGIAYDDSDAVSSTSEGMVTFEVAQPLKVKLNIPEIPQQINAGDVLPLTLQAMNVGRGGVFNVRCEMDVDGLSSSTTPFFGNMEPGTDKAVDMNIFVGTKEQGGEQYGPTNGIITLIYEDQSGKEETQTFNISTMIEKPVIAQTSGNDSDKKPKGQWWITLVIGVVAVAGGIGYMVWNKRKKQDENS